jgi:hypothetical protein
MTAGEGDDVADGGRGPCDGEDAARSWRVRATTVVRRAKLSVISKKLSRG